MTSLKFLLDADDVLLRTGSSKVKWMQNNLTDNDLIDKSRTVESISEHECSRTALVPIIDEPNYERMTSYVYSLEGTLATHPLNGALEGVSELARLGEIYVISARKPQDVVNTRAWLKANSFYQFLDDSRVSSTGDPQYSGIPEIAGSKKVGIAKNFFQARMFVDDDERHMPTEPVEGLDCLLFGEMERKTNQHIIPARNWQEVVRFAQKRYSNPL